MEEEKPTPAEVRSRLRLVEDHNLAQRLQDEEYGIHYDHNRSERRTVGGDVRKSKTEQQREDEIAREMRRAQNRQIEETDEEMARRIAHEWQMEEDRKRSEREQQLRRDEELARRMLEGPETPLSTPMQPDPLIGISGSSSDYDPYRQSSYHNNATTNMPSTAMQPSVSSIQPTPPSLVGPPSLPPSSYPAPSAQPDLSLPPPSLIPKNAIRVLPPLSSSSSLPSPPVSLPAPSGPALTSVSSIDSPIYWPPPPSSIAPPRPPPPIGFSSNNPFLSDLQNQAQSTVTPQSSWDPAMPSISSLSISTHHPAPYENVTQTVSPTPDHSLITTFGVSPTSSASYGAPTPQFHSEFGLPPPSSLALGHPK